ncbi:hypothetical protein STEG23_034639 [Scotinomys teguina]
MEALIQIAMTSCLGENAASDSVHQSLSSQSRHRRQEAKPFEGVKQYVTMATVQSSPDDSSIRVDLTLAPIDVLF